MVWVKTFVNEPDEHWEPTPDEIEAVAAELRANRVYADPADDLRGQVRWPRGQLFRTPRVGWELTGEGYRKTTRRNH